MTHFILISGDAGAGKDEFAKNLKAELEADNQSVLITHYADLLKYILEKFFNWDGVKDEAGRTLLQQVGTDCIRKQSPDFWVDFITTVISFFPDKFDYVLIADVRFQNEISGVKKAGFPAIHVRVVRPELQSKLNERQKSHISENALKNIAPDYVVNNTSLEALKNHAKALFHSIKLGQEP